MALYYTLPVYKASYKLMIVLFATSENFARQYKYTTGQELKDQGMELIKNIYRANKAMDKAASIGQARENVEMIRLFVRLMQDFDQIGLKKFVEINLCIENVSKQLANWEAYGKAKITPPESSVVRAQASVRSKSNNPLALREEYRPNIGRVSQPHQQGRATNPAVILPLAGNRNNGSGSMNNLGSNGNYWSSSGNGANAFNLNFNTGGVNPGNNNNRGNGFSVRCLKDLQTHDHQ